MCSLWVDMRVHRRWVDVSVHCDQVSQDSSLCYLHCTIPRVHSLSMSYGLPWRVSYMSIVCVLPSIPVMYVGQIGIHRSVLRTYPVRYVGLTHGIVECSSAQESPQNYVGHSYVRQWDRRGITMDIIS